jgi:hypothetical protein
MPSEVGRGFKFGVGFALGVGFIMILLLGSLSMCAGHLHRRMIDKMQQMVPDKEQSPQEVPDSLLSRAIY